MEIKLVICAVLLSTLHRYGDGGKNKYPFMFGGGGKIKNPFKIKGGSKMKNPMIIVLNYPPPVETPVYEYPTFEIPPSYIVWYEEVYDDVIAYDPNFYEPCAAPNCNSPIIDHKDPQEKEDEDYEKLNKNITKPSLEAFKRTWTDPYAERPSDHERFNEMRYLDMVNDISLERTGVIPYHMMHYGRLQYGPYYGRSQFGPYGDHNGRYRRSAKQSMIGGRVRRSVAAKVATSKTVRKSYHTLTPAERERFHKAVQGLKASGAYDTLGRRHILKDAPGAHNGPAFLLWHRNYILQFEVALQLIDPGVFLPYWDSSLESRLGYRFRETCLFDSHSLGQWKGGPVIDGAFANFTAYKGCTGTGKILTRKVGWNTLYTSGDFNLYDSYRWFDELAGDSGFEDDHGYIHVAVGGHLANLNCAPVDPIFFMHHAFVDYLWWRFRKTQFGNITTEYVPYPLKHHKLNDTMKPFNGTKNSDGLKLMTSVTYEESPSMTRCWEHAQCQSDMLWCDRGRCTAKVRVGTWCHRKNPSSCFCEHGIPSCAGKRRWNRRHMKCVCTDPKNPTNEGNTATPPKPKPAVKTGKGTTHHHGGIPTHNIGIPLHKVGIPPHHVGGT